MGQYPTSIAVDPKTNMVYVANFYDNTISVRDGNTNTVVKNVDVGHYPIRNSSVDPKTNMVYVANFKDNTTSVISGLTNSVVKTVWVGGHPRGIDCDPVTNTLYVSNRDTNNISIIKEMDLLGNGNKFTQKPLSK